jgi:guanylate kinase
VKPFLLILSSPSGGGKTTIARALVAARDDLGYSVSATTREPRPGEEDGVDYHYFSRKEFSKRRDAGEFLEWAEYGGAFYGTLESEVDRILTSERHAILDIEVRGAKQIRERRSDVVSIFVVPPSATALLERLVGRDASLDTEGVRARLLRAVGELEEAPNYDYVVVNEDRTQVVSEVAAIIDSESRRAHRISSLADSIKELRQDLEGIIEGMAPESGD